MGVWGGSECGVGGSECGVGGEWGGSECGVGESGAVGVTGRMGV